MAALPWRFLGAGKVARWLTAVLVIGPAIVRADAALGNVQWLPQKLSKRRDGGRQLYRRFGHQREPRRHGGAVADPAFYVKVTDHAGGVKRLSGDPLWYVESLDFYQGNHWRSWSQANRSFA